MRTIEPHCGSCRRWREQFPGHDWPDTDRLGLRGWRGPLPYAWRHARRELVATGADEGAGCPQYLGAANGAELGPAPFPGEAAP
jgi:hypothetical protein